MLAAEPGLLRQLSDRDPILLWRDRAGHREGLALLPMSCAAPGCSCREMVVDALAIDDDLIGVASDGQRASLIWAQASPGQGACVLRVEVDIDAGTAIPHESASPAQRDADALAWLRAELADGPLLDHVRRRFRLDKHLTVTPPPPKPFAWHRWKPGDQVFWEEVFPEATPTEPVVVAGRTLGVREWYCANPECECGDIEVYVYEVLPDGTKPLVGSLHIDFHAAILSDLRAMEQQQTAALAEVWAMLKARHDIARYFGRRRRAIQAAASEGVNRSSRSPTAPSPTRPLAAGRNAPCPCGSGLKYKRCCLGKAAPNPA